MDTFQGPSLYTRSLFPFYRGENRLRESKAAQGHRAGGCWGWEANPGTLASKFHLLTLHSHEAQSRVPASLTVISGLAGICSVQWVLSSHSTFAQVFPSAGGAPFPSQPHSTSHPLGLSFSITAPGSPRHCSGSPKPL